MIATMTVQSQLKDPLPSRNSNSAGAPLPGIPRRISSGARPKSVPSSPPLSSSVPSITVVVQQSTPPHSSQPPISTPSKSGSKPDLGETSGLISISAARQVRPPEHSTPTPTVHNARLEQQRQPLAVEGFTSMSPNASTSDTAARRQPLIYTPGISLRLTTEQLKIRNFSESYARPSLNPLARSASTSSTPTLSQSSSNTEPRLIRKKSGQLVKSSLKSSKSLSVVTRSLGSKSEPNTPTHAKAVHFDAQLEHVKLFLAEQKPLAVSRDGSPTEDTSGTDTDFPSFIFGPDGDEKRKNLVMHTPNMPVRPKSNSDVVLEELKIGTDALSIVGKVRVRNIAFSKWVVARFTFDEWQTTSEVTAVYSQSRSAEFDEFVFNVRLNDLMARIEGKKMWLAVRYTVGDREMWDNNDSRNYLAEFSIGAPPRGPSPNEKEKERGRERRKARSGTAEDSSSSASERDIADLRSKLEKVVQPSRPKLSPSHPAFSARYQFPSSPTESWKSSFGSHHSTPSPRARGGLHPHSHMHLRTNSYPLTTVNSTPRPKSFPAAVSPRKISTNTIPWPEKGKRASPPLGSPRDADEDVLFSAPRKSFEVEDAPFPIPVSDGDVSVGGSGERSGSRNHRRGYFAGAHTAERSSLKRTPPGTPSSSCDSLDDDSLEEESTPTISRLYGLGSGRMVKSAPVYGLGFRRALYGDESEASEESTPSLTSSRDSSPSPTESMLYVRDGTDEEEARLSPDTNYREFLNRFCFFTGSGNQPHLLPPSPSPDPTSGADPRGQYQSTHSRSHTHPHVDHRKPISVTRAPRHSSSSDIDFIIGSASPHLHHFQPPTEPAYVLAATAKSMSLDDIASLSPRSGSATPQLISPTVVMPLVA